MLRCEDLPLVDRAKRLFHQALMVIVGPAQPRTIEPYLKLIVDELAILSPLGNYENKTCPYTCE